MSQSMTATAPHPAPPAPQGSAREAIVQVENLGFRYGARAALEGISLSVPRGALFGLLGPNGSGKSTFFRILSTALRPGAGSVRIDGHDVTRASDAARSRLGVVFQAPSLDGKLTVSENLRFHGMLFGLRGAALRERCAEMLERFSLTARRAERVDTLSGGLKRRVELAKALLPAPPLLLLDEPSSGLDPAARLEFWNVLGALRERAGLTVVVATHLMDEAERCDRVALLDQGRLVVEDAPEALRRQVGGDVVTVEGAQLAGLAERIRRRLALDAAVVDGRLRIQTADSLGTAARLLEHFGDEIHAITLGRPTLEDVFLARTGRSLAADDPAAPGAEERP